MKNSVAKMFFTIGLLDIEDLGGIDLIWLKKNSLPSYNLQCKFQHII